MRIYTVEEYRGQFGNNPRRRGQLTALARVAEEHPETVVCVVSDERTGRRFGRAVRRVGLCAKLGHTTYDYQAWASWAPADIAGVP